MTFSVRRSAQDDVDTIAALFDRTFDNDVPTDWFTRFHALPEASMKTPAMKQSFFVSLIETCFMSVTIEDDEGHIAGFVALDDAPLQMVRRAPVGTYWEDWLRQAYDEPSIDSTNSLWLVCCLVEPEAAVMAEILRSTFSTLTDVQNLLVYVPGGLAEQEAVQLLDPFEVHFQELRPTRAEASEGHWTDDGSGARPLLMRCARSSIVTPLNIRMARVEDHDDLAAVFNTQSEVVTEVYGEFFIAELVEAQNEENKALVAEVDGRAKGLMCLTSDVDINVLAQCFELDAYDNLLKPGYMRRVREHAEAFERGEAAYLCETGDYLQAALSSFDVEAVLDPLPRAEDGRLPALAVMQALMRQEFADEVGQVVRDLGRTMMTLMWQANWTDPMLEGGSTIDMARLIGCVQMFLELTTEARREIAATVLTRWDEIMEIYNLIPRESVIIGSPELGDIAEEQPPKDEEQQEEEHADAPVQMGMLMKALSEEEEGPFSQDFLAKLIMVLHWWENEDLSDPLKPVPDDVFRSSLERMAVSEEGLFVSSPDSPAWLANMPAHSKDVFCVNMCCLDQAFQTQALDLMLPAFALFPEKDYCIITQPHTAPSSPLLNAFTIVPPKPQNTFGHVLYLIHRAALLGPPRVRFLQLPDLGAVSNLMQNLEFEARDDITAKCDAFVNMANTPKEEMAELAMVAEFDGQVVGLVMLRVPEPHVVANLRCCYHLDDYLLVEHHEGGEPQRGHAELLHTIVNPLFAKYTGRLHQGALRLSGRTVLFMETDLRQPVPPTFRELLQVAPRRPPQLKKIPRKPPVVASFANVPPEVPTDDDIREKERQALLRDKTQTMALSIVPKNLLSETKIPMNARIVVVGASDCGLSVLESLLGQMHLMFNSLTLLAPGGLEYHHEHHLPLLAGTAAYSHHELRRVMLELRVRILDSRMLQIDRQQRCVVLHDGSMLPYDYLVVAAGLQDDALHSMKIRSWGVEHVTDGYRRVNGCMSVADPSIRGLLEEGGTLIKSLIWNPLSYAVVYGRSLDAYCVIQGLLMRKVPPTKIILVLPPRLKDSSHQRPVDAFDEGDEVERKIHGLLTNMGVQVYDDYKLLDIQQDNRKRLKALVLEETAGPRAGEAEAPAEGDAARPARVPGGVMADAGVSPGGLPLKTLACRIVISADSVNVDPDIFNSVHGNGLVYDGRLIVDHNFKTTDEAIFGAGSLCEFSRRFQRKNAMRYLRHDGFNGREVGAKLARALLRVLDPVNGDSPAPGGNAHAAAAPDQATPAGATPGTQPVQASEGQELTMFEGLDSEEASPDLLPEFFMPIARGGFLPGGLHLYRICSCRRGELEAERAEPSPDQTIVTDTLDTSNWSGHYCRLTIDSFGRVDSIAYLGYEELQVESLWSLVGLSETFLNHLFVRWKSGDIPDIVEFLTDEWATALFHDRFAEFCDQIKVEMRSQEEVRKIIDDALRTVDLKEGLSRELLAQIRANLPKESVKAIQDHLLDYLRENTNHLRAYFLPENWAPEPR